MTCGSTRYRRTWRGQTMAERVYYLDELSERAREDALDKLREEDWFDDVDVQWTSDDAKRYLERKGYRGAEVSWSVGFCQGDYFSFYNADIDVRQVARRLLGKKFRRAERFYAKRTRYPHGSSKRGDSLADCFAVSLQTGGRRETVEVVVNYRGSDFVMGVDFVRLADSERPMDASFRSFKFGRMHGDGNSTEMVEIDGIDHLATPLYEEDCFEDLRRVLEDAIQKEVDALCHELERSIGEEILYRSSDENIIEHCNGNDRRFFRDGKEDELGTGRLARHA